MGLRLPRNQLGQDAAKTQLIFAHRGPHPVVTGGCRVTLVEDEVNDLEHRRQPGVQFGASRNFEGDSLFGQGVRLSRTMR